MQRRAVLRAVGFGTAVATAGCLGGDSDGDGTGDPAGSGDGGADDGETYEAANEFDYPTMSVQGIDVPLVPNDDAFEWYTDDDAVFADTRSREEYDRAHITGAVFSPAAHGRSSDDPLEELPTDTRIVTYCACPHTLAGLRAASLIRDGYVHTYALDEGIPQWDEAGYPIDDG